MSLQLSPVSSGSCFSADIKYNGPDGDQDLDAFRYSIVDFPLLYTAGERETVRYKGVYCDSALFLPTGTDDCAPRTSVRTFARYALVYGILHDGFWRLTMNKTQLTSRCRGSRLSSRKMKSPIGLRR